jgi:hypothetical protein
MAYVGDPFRHDIFVSYSHGDVQRDGQALLKQWSQGFVEELKRELQTFPELGAQLSVFLDEGYRPGQNIDPMAPLSDTLRTEVAGAAILAILMTPHYLGSQWCQQELAWWIEAQRANKLAHDDRIAIARVWPTGSAGWPADLVDRAGNPYVGHHFFDRARSETRPQPFSWPHVTSATGDPFRNALLDFVGAIQLRLREIRKQLELRKAEETALQRLSIHAGQVLYLHGRTAHAPIWERVHQELEDDGYTVFPMEPEQVENDPRKIRETQKERISTMSGCDAVLLLGTEDVRALQADLMVIGRLDRHQAVAQSNRLLPCGVVDTVGVVRERPDWSRKAKGLGVDWIDASVSPWTPQVKAWLNGAAT